jgi:hypothetical protein
MSTSDALRKFRMLTQPTHWLARLPGPNLSASRDLRVREIKMRTFIFAVAAIVATSWAIDQARSADRIPTFKDCPVKWT